MPRGAKKQKSNSEINKKNAVAEAPAGPSTETPAAGGATAGVAVALPVELQLLSNVLQFSDMRHDQASICRLLATSKAAAAIVAEDCKGQLHINLSPNGYDHAAEKNCAAQAAWLKRNGLLVRDLTAMSSYGSWDPSLQHLKTTLGTLLPTVASSMPLLTKLTGRLYVSTFTTAAAYSQLSSSLAGLTSLQHLKLQLSNAEAGRGAQPLMAALKAAAQQLPGLTHCELYIEGTGPRFMHMSSAGLESLPASLQSLGLTVKLGLHDSNAEMGVMEAGLGEFLAGSGGKGFDQTFMMKPYPSAPQPPLKLGHLTALKALKPYAGRTGELAELAIREGDVLPPNLTELVLDADYRSLDGALTGALARPTVGPLMPLKNLQVLVVQNSKASAAQLQRLAAALTPPGGSLKVVSLGYSSWKAAAGAAAAWPKLPLIDLNIYERMDYSDYGEFSEFGGEFGSSGEEEGSSLEHVAEVLFTPMSQLTALTSLVCSVSSAKPSAQLLANTVSGLSKLQTLSLSFGYRHEFPHHFESVEEVRSVEALARAIAALPNLRDLQLGFPLPGVAAAIADGACAQQLTSLTSLKLEGLSDADVELLHSSPAGAALSVPRGF